MELDRDGAQRFAAAFNPEAVAALRDFFSSFARSARLAHMPGLAALIAPADMIAKAVLGPDARPVGAKWFDKSPERNWALGWHQDRTIAVHGRLEVPGFAQWTVKSGVPHCVPPFGYLDRSLTLRIHLDPVREDNSPLLVAPGSHRLGPVPEPQIAAAVGRLGSVPCIAAAGDVWACATPILHASARAANPSRRRVLQCLYSAEALSGGLAWTGI